MKPYDREAFKRVAQGVRIRVQYDRGPDPRYAITLEALVDDAWTTIRCWDNAHGQGHHMHRYTQQHGRGAPTLFVQGTWREAMPLAIAAAEESWEGILQSWRR